MLKKQIEALIFASPEGLTVEDMCNLLKCERSQVIEVLEDLGEEYSERSFDINCTGNKWSIVMKPEVTHIVKNSTHSELTKAVQETLAVIAYFNPAKQSDIVKFRGNKSYEHIHELRDKGFVKTKHSGRTLKIWVTDKFYRYFSINPGEEKYLFGQVNVKNRVND